MGLTFGKMLDMPPLWLLAFAAFLWWLDQLVPIETGSAFLVSLGTGFVTGGCVCILLAAWQFRVHKTSIVPHQTAKALITTGVYGRSRNPIYFADALILAGLALRWDFWPGLALVPLFMWVIQTRFIHPEEARLKAAFPTEFAEYASKTRRWL